MGSKEWMILWAVHSHPRYLQGILLIALHCTLDASAAFHDKFITPLCRFLNQSGAPVRELDGPIKRLLKGHTSTPSINSHGGEENDFDRGNVKETGLLACIISDLFITLYDVLPKSDLHSVHAFATAADMFVDTDKLGCNLIGYCDNAWSTKGGNKFIVKSRGCIQGVVEGCRNVYPGDIEDGALHAFKEFVVYGRFV